MTISSTTRIAGPFLSGTALPFTFKVFAAADLEVVRLNTSTGVETTLVLNSDYTVALNGNQNTNPGGTVNLTVAASATSTVTITSDIANLQPTDLTNQGGFYPEVITDALDRATIQIQQMSEDVGRSLKGPISDGNLNMELPTAAQRANSFLAFDANGVPTAVVSGSSGAPTTITRQVFSGTGSQTVFTLASDPGALGNSAQVFIGGVYQQRSTYTIAGTTLTFSQAPVAGTDNIEFVNFLTSNIGATSADLVTYTPSGVGAVARSAASKMGDVVSVKDFGAVGDGVADDTAAIQAAVTAAVAGCGYVYLPSGTYKITSSITVTATAAGVRHYCSFIGDGPSNTTISVAMSSGAAINYTQNATFRFHLVPKITGIAFVQSGTAGTSIGVRLNATFGGLVEFCNFVGLGGDAISLRSTVGDQDLVALVSVRGCRMSTCGGWAINIDLSASNGASANHQFVQNYVSNCNGAFKLMAYGGLVQHNTIANDLSGVTNPDILLDYNGVTPNQWIIDGNWMEKGRVAAVRATGAVDCQFTNNAIIYNSATSGLVGFDFAGTTASKARCNFSGNRFVLDSSLAFNCYQDSGAATNLYNNIADSHFMVFGGSNVKYNLTGTDWRVRENGNPVNGLNADYEEGTWTVTLYDAVTGGNASPTTVTGFYTRNGRLVTVSFRQLLNIDTTGMTAGNFLYLSLPFVCVTAGVAFVGSAITSSLTYPAGITTIVPHVANGAARALMQTSGSAAASSYLLVSDITSGTTDINTWTLEYFTT